MSKKASQVMATLMVVVLLLGVVEIAKACNPLELTPCLSAIQIGSLPSPTSPCCVALKKQTKECLCSFFTNSETSKYLCSPTAQGIPQVCGIAFPSDC
uniref:Bifunctional inhibitor/plant lipid transfer protein/seed storage helical domain-containing protein n=1 Tax=Chenopodium quinoa TaxID=63459 RepID=A0A803LAZ5_CHEQI